MKPGDHPEFFRFAPPPGQSRESTIRLDREGRFFHDGEQIEHAKLCEAMHRWLARHPDDGRYILTNGYDWTYLTVDDTPFFVTALRVEGDHVTMTLSTGAEAPLDGSTLTEGSDGSLYARVSSNGFTGEARFSRHAQTQLSPLVVERDDRAALSLDGALVVPPPRPSR